MKFWEDFPKEVAFELCGEKRGPRLSSKLDFKHCSSFYAGPREPQRGRQAVVVCGERGGAPIYPRRLCLFQRMGPHSVLNRV